MLRLTWLAWFLVVAACLPAPPDSTPGSAPHQATPFGEDGTFAFITLRESMRVGVEGQRVVTLLLPLHDIRDAASLPDRTPGVVMVQGGLVARERYLWLARHLASRGIAVILPEYVGWLAFFEPAIASASVDHLEVRLGEQLSAVAIMGHSLGGVMAVRGALEDDRFDAVILLASQAADGDPIGSLEIPLLSIAGARDASIAPEAIRPTVEQWGGIGFFAVVDPLTHFAWTDPGRDPTVLRETESPSPDLDAARFAGRYLVDAMVEWSLRGDPAGRSALEAGPDTPAAITTLEALP